MLRLGNLVTRRPRWVVTVAAIVFVLGGVIGAPLLGGLTAGGFEDPDAEFVKARDRIESATGVAASPDMIALVSPGSDVGSGAGQAKVAEVAREVAADPDVAQVLTPATAGPVLVAEDGRSAYLPIFFRPLGDDDTEDAAARVDDLLGDDSQVQLGGVAAIGSEVGDIVSSDLARAELIAFPIILLLSLWVFRGLIAALLPPLLGGLTILAAFLSIGLINQATTISVYALNMMIGLGLGLAIDYTLLMISRYREELAAHGPGREAMMRTMRTAGRSVLFSAVTVAAALAGLMIFPQRFLFSMGLGGVVVALLAAVAALLVLPAILFLLGSRINALAPRALRRRSEQENELRHSGFWYRLSHAVMRRPGIIAIATVAVLVVVALPAFGINFTSVDARALPAGSEARQVSDTLMRDFPQDLSDPINVVADAPATPQARAALESYAGRLGDLPGVTAVAPPQQVGPGTWQIQVIGSGDVLSESNQQVVSDVRSTASPYSTLVGGGAASFVDEKESIGAHLPWAILAIAATTIVALFLMTGSVLLPIKAVIMNLLTLGATLGMLTWVFQDGRLEGVLDYTSTGALDLTSPILLGAIAFGLSTDYAVFLLSRIKEAHDAGADTRQAVASGLQRTGRIVTAAALLLAVAIGAFATSEISFIKQLGLGTAFAVLVDATIIRALLVPSLMGLLGRWNWWAPRPLARLHKRIGLSEADPKPA